MEKYEKIEELYQSWLTEKNPGCKQEILEYVASCFEEILKNSGLGRFLGDMPELTATDTKEWMHEQYLDEAEHFLEKHRPVKNFMSSFGQLYAYNMKKRIIDHIAQLYADTGYTDIRKRTYLWEETYRLFDDIKGFDGIRGFTKPSLFNSVKEQEEWMHEVFTDTILECMKKYDPSKKESYVGYTVDIFGKRLINAYNKLKKEKQKSVLRKTKEESISEVGDEEEDCRKRKGYIESPLERAILKKNEELAIAWFNLYMNRILTDIIRLYEAQEHRNASGKLKKADYFRFFFTENIIKTVKICSEYDVEGQDLKNEDEIFASVDTDLMDFVLVAACRTFEQLMLVPLKQTDAILHNGDSEIVHIPFEEAVYLVFINEVIGLVRSPGVVSASISNYRGKYNEQIKLLMKGMKH